MACRLYIFSALLMLADISDSAKILGIFGMPSKSHVISISTLLTELANRGHEVTVISAFPLDPPINNIVFKINSDDHVTTSFKNEMSFWEIFKIMWSMRIAFCEKIVSQPPIQELIERKDLHFDLIIFETVFSECLFGFVHKFQAPYIHYFPNTLDATMQDSVGNVYGLSYVPSLLLSTNGRMTFKDRLSNTLVASSMALSTNLIVSPHQDAIMRKYFKDPSLPPLSEMIQNASLLILNSHFSQHHPRPYTPNTIEVGGMHVRPVKKLPEELQQFLDDASNGVIYFSMGSNVRSSTMTDEMKQAFLSAFAKLKQKVLWKWETDTLPGQPDNVKLGKWMPQNDILAHPNVRVFITHGGLMSSQEAIYHGVPLLTIPVFGDQRSNSITAQSKGYAIMLEIANITTDSLSWALNELLNNPRYREEVKRMSALLRDQPETPLERGVYWIEYVIRHKGARHLRSAALDLYWYQYYLLDVIAVLVGAVVFCMLVLYLFCRTVYRLLVFRTSTTPSKAKKMN